MPPVARPIIGNFRIDGNGCWNWIGPVNGSGYPLIRFIGRKVLGNRLIAHLYLGLKLDDKKSHALHRCDNPKCLNPKHIFIGSHLQNMQDMARKGRGSSGHGKETHCPHGHEYDAKNTGITTNPPGRSCRTCRRERERLRRQRMKSE